MIRTIITPEQQDIFIHLPISFVGKRVEVLLYTLEEMSEQDSVKQTQHQIKKRKAGILKGKIWMADDFDAPLDDFKDYM